MEWWQGFISAALVGCDRQTPALPQTPDALAGLVRQLDWTDPASAILSAAGTVALYQQVGQRPSQFSDRASQAADSCWKAPQPCAPDQLPCCSPRIARYLDTALDEYPQVVVELLLLMAEAGQRVPPSGLPKLLTFGEKHNELAFAIDAVLGQRGRWLAQQNPSWHYASVLRGEGVADEQPVDLSVLRSRWYEGGRAERLQAIQQWRRVDPEGAREAIAETWSSTAWRDRTALLQILTVRLSLADEPFLEAALNDRAKGVRHQAADLLAQLPTSQLCQRMAKRVRQFVTLSVNDAKTDKSLTIHVSLPETFERAWTRDGMSQQPLNGLGERASWLQQMLAKTPLECWQFDEGRDARSGTQPVEPHSIVEAIADHEWRAVLLGGWAMAVTYQRRSEQAAVWAQALLHQFGAYELEETVLKTLLSLLSPSERAQYLRSQRPPPNNDHNAAHWLRLVAESNQQWDFDFSRIVLAQLLALLENKPRYGELFRPPVSLAMALHPGLALEAAQQVRMLPQKPTASWQRFLDEFLGVLTLRWQIYQAFAESG
ncbi:MAG: DUF5691 domain-containing protein [Cyanobacteria bacterium J06614_10]